MQRREAEPTNRWLREMRGVPRPDLRLVCLPHAGGAASFFHPWAQSVPEGVELLAVRYPGREDRFLDPPARTMAELAEPIARECARLADSGVPLALFGHSMGASVAHEVALRLRSDHGVALAGLFLSGRRGPGHEQPTGLADADDEELISAVGRLGGTDPRIFADPGLRALVLPLIRADYRLLESHRTPTGGPPLDVPVVAYYGTRDERVDPESVAAWSSATRSSFRARPFEGGHFYLVDRLRPLLADLFATLGHPLAA